MFLLKEMTPGDAQIQQAETYPSLDHAKVLSGDLLFVTVKKTGGMIAN